MPARQETTEEHLPRQETRPGPPARQRHIQDHSNPASHLTCRNALTHRHCIKVPHPRGGGGRGRGAGTRAARGRRAAPARALHESERPVAQPHPPRQPSPAHRVPGRRGIQPRGCGTLTVLPITLPQPRGGGCWGRGRGPGTRAARGTRTAAASRKLDADPAERSCSHWFRSVPWIRAASWPGPVCHRQSGVGSATIGTRHRVKLAD